MIEIAAGPQNHRYFVGNIASALHLLLDAAYFQTRINPLKLLGSVRSAMSNYEFIRYRALFLQFPFLRTWKGKSLRRDRGGKSIMHSETKSFRCRAKGMLCRAL